MKRFWSWLFTPYGPTIVIKTIEGRRSDNRPVLPQGKWNEQVRLLESRGARNPMEKKK